MTNKKLRAGVIGCGLGAYHGYANASFTPSPATPQLVDVADRAPWNNLRT